MEMAVEVGVQHFRLRNHTRMFADPLIGWLVAFFGSHKLGIVSEKSHLISFVVKMRAYGITLLCNLMNCPNENAFYRISPVYVSNGT